MNFLLSEDEYNAIGAVRGQLGLVAGLLTANGAHSDLYNASDLYDFLGAQVDALRGIISAVDERYEVQCEVREEALEMNALDWVYAIRIANGDALHTPSGSAERITRCLEKAAQIEATMKWVLDAWLHALLRNASGAAPNGIGYSGSVKATKPTTAEKTAKSGRKTATQ